MNSLPQEEIDYLRTLAKKQASIAALPIMQERKKMWTDMNDAVKGARPPFAVETWTFDGDFMPPSVYKCHTKYGCGLEYNFLRNIRIHELINDDHVCPDTIDMSWHVWCDEFGIEIKTTHAEGSGGYHFECPIKNLNDGFDMVKPSRFGVNRESTMEEKAFLEKNFGDIMPVVIRSGTYGSNNLTQRLMRLISMENFFVAMYECPDKVHALMSMLRDNAKRMALWAEEEGLLVVNNGNDTTCGTCYNFTTLLPGANFTPGKVKLSNMWSVMDSQETVGISPDMFHEFCFPYYEDLASLYGLVYWGCCEPVDPIWESSISKLPNLKAVSISKWADQRCIAEALSGKGIVYSRKPDPNLIGVEMELDERAWRNEINTTLDITKDKNIPLEFIVRDVYSIHGIFHKLRRVVEIAREEIDRFFPKV